MTFSSPEGAREAQLGLNEQIFEGRRMNVQYAHRDGPQAPAKAARPSYRSDPSNTVFIGNLSFEMSDQDLNNLFKEIRNVIDVRIAIDRRSGQPRGFAHADFPDVESAKAAVKQLENKVVHGRKLRVDYSSHSSQRRTLSGE